MATKTSSKNDGNHTAVTEAVAEVAVKSSPKNTEDQSPSPERIKVLKTYKIYIGGQFPRSESGRYYPITLKSGKVVNVALSSRKDFRNAVTVAREAQEKWNAKSALNRSQILYRIAEMLETRSIQFVSELVQQGRTEVQAKKEVETAIDRLIYFAGWCDKYNPIFSSVNPVSSSHFNFSSTEPIGVVSAIAPQENGLIGLVSIIAPVIAGGNTIIILASNKMPLCAVTFAEVLNSSDLPGGVVNILTGEVPELLTHFSNHMDVNAVYLSTDDVKLATLVETNAAMNVKRARVEGTMDWMSSETETPYRIMDFLEIKTTWHPIGI